jgi:poly-gamma-glutamate synthesis protein (capsule biosynthesis protein)
MREQIPPLGRGGIVLSFVGDVLWIEGNWSSFAAPAAPLLAADMRIGNLETQTSARHPPQNAGAPVRFNAPVQMLDRLPLDLIQLTNNHALDMGDSGLESTVEEVRRRGYRTTGVDQQAIVPVGGTRVAIMAYTWGVNRRDFTSQHQLFIVPFGHLDQPIDLSLIAHDIENARREAADSIVVLLHWGYEFEYYPAPHFMQIARQIIELGADLIVAEGPHVVQPAEICQVNRPETRPGIGTCSIVTSDGVPRTAAVLYSLGNFTNDGPAGPPVLVGINAKVSLNQHEVTGLGWSPVLFRLDRLQTVPADWEQADPEIAAELDRLDRHIGKRWRVWAAPQP